MSNIQKYASKEDYWQYLAEVKMYCDRLEYLYNFAIPVMVNGELTRQFPNELIPEVGFITQSMEQIKNRFINIYM